MAQQRQEALESATSLCRALRAALGIELAEDSYNRTVTIFNEARQKIWPLLQAVQFTDIVSFDECVGALNGWNNLLRIIVELLPLAHIRLDKLQQKTPKNLACSDIREFMKELHGVVTRVVEHLTTLIQ